MTFTFERDSWLTCIKDLTQGKGATPRYGWIRGHHPVHPGKSLPTRWCIHPGGLWYRTDQMFWWIVKSFNPDSWLTARWGQERHKKLEISSGQRKRKEIEESKSFMMIPITFFQTFIAIRLIHYLPPALWFTRKIFLFDHGRDVHRVIHDVPGKILSFFLLQSGRVSLVKAIYIYIVIFIITCYRHLRAAARAMYMYLFLSGELVHFRTAYRSPLSWAHSPILL